MQERITKTLSFPKAVAKAVEREAQKERRSFTRQVEILLESALARQNQGAEAEAQN